MIDRGADLAWLSQYPHEREVAFPPLTAFELDAPTHAPASAARRIEGDVTILGVRALVKGAREPPTGAGGESAVAHLVMAARSASPPPPLPLPPASRPAALKRPVGGAGPMLQGAQAGGGGGEPRTDEHEGAAYAESLVRGN
jgi:hypothetical protein